jgi:HPt (histidine-containing phosphotransfer) domain-containing protein
MKGDRERCLEVGMDDHVSNTLRSEELSRAMERSADAGAAGQSFNHERALAQVDGDLELLNDLFALLRDDAPRRLEAIAGGIANDDREAIRNAAHALRGAMVNFAANRACDIATEIERAGDDVTREELAAMLARLEAEVARLVADIGAMLAREGNGA